MFAEGDGPLHITTDSAPPMFYVNYVADLVELLIDCEPVTLRSFKAYV